MKSLCRLGILSAALILSACAQNISQVVNVDTRKQNELLERIATQLGPSPTALPSRSPVDEPTPDIPQPGLPAAGPGTSTDTSVAAPDIFRQDIPQPIHVKGYQPSDIAKAVENWKIRYQTAGQSPYEVLKMAVDARLLSGQSLNLSMALLDIITTEPFYPSLYRNKRDFMEEIRKNSQYMSEYAAGMYGYESDLDASDASHREVFKRRALRVFTNPVYERRKELERPQDLTPAYPQASDTVVVRIIYHNYFERDVDTIANGFEAGVVYESGQWKLLPDSFRSGGVHVPYED